jgi:Predicted transcriptional regulators
MGKIPDELRKIIAANISACRRKKFPGSGGGKRCAAAFGVSPQQCSPWERGVRTPDEYRLQKLAEFFGVTVAYLRTDHDSPEQGTPSFFSLPMHDSHLQHEDFSASPQPAYFHCPFFPSLKPEQAASASVRDLCRVAERLITEIREFGLTIRFHPDDMEKLANLCVKRMKPSE